jgi:hypothetical protein
MADKTQFNVGETLIPGGGVTSNTAVTGATLRVAIENLAGVEQAVLLNNASVNLVAGVEKTLVAAGATNWTCIAGEYRLAVTLSGGTPAITSEKWTSGFAVVALSAPAAPVISVAQLTITTARVTIVGVGGVVYYVDVSTDWGVSWTNKGNCTGSGTVDITLTTGEWYLVAAYGVYGGIQGKMSRLRFPRPRIRPKQQAVDERAGRVGLARRIPEHRGKRVQERTRPVNVLGAQRAGRTCDPPGVHGHHGRCAESCRGRLAMNTHRRRR